MPAPQKDFSDREERLEFVLMKHNCNAPSCGYCSSCHLPGGLSAIDLFDDYIEGRCEYVDIASKLWEEM